MKELLIAKNRYQPQRNDDKERINDQIQADKVRVIKPDGEHDIVPIERALEMAGRLNLDLVEIAAAARPPVVKIMDYGKFIYEKKKKEKEAKKKQHTVQVKELRFRPHTDDHDFDFKTKHARKFLEDGNKVKVIVQFRGRDIIYSDQGKQLMVRLAEELSDIGKIESAPKLEGKRMNMMLTPAK